jgi:F0F1-type ATP synthase membrane subunit b/b'
MVPDPLAQIDPLAIAGVSAIFLVTFLLLRRMCLVPLVEVMERRAGRIEAAGAARAEAEGVLRQARAEADRLLAAAREEAGRIAEAAKEERSRAREARMAVARESADAAVAAGREAIQSLARAQEAAVADHLRACVCEILTRLVGEVDEPRVRFLVARALAAKEAR